MRSIQYLRRRFRMSSQYTIPFGSWYEPGKITLEFPENWDVTMYAMDNAPELIGKEPYEHAIDNPIGCEPIKELARGKETAAIVIDDTSRSTRMHEVLGVLLDRLNAAGIPDGNITVISALGAHRPMMRQDFIKKVGLDVLNRVDVVNHVPWYNLESLGESKLGTPIQVNKTYHDADLKISVGGVIPHPLAGYGGGAKIILPGICGMGTLESNHSLAMKAGIGIGLGRITDVRNDIEDVATRIGLDFSINIIPNAWGKNAAVFAGHYIDAHRKAIEFSERYFRTDVKKKARYDVGFFNAFPEDTELNQCVKALNIFLLNQLMVERKGVVVILTASSEGRGYHALLAETGAPLYTNHGESVLWAAKGRRKVGLFSPNVTKSDVLQLFPGDIIFNRDFNALLKDIEAVAGENPTACLFQNSIQMPRVIKEPKIGK
ncbi:DUF2088 domain-containing protein [Candidatus Bathyarchaeota archaeon]|nr:DUF2088 domain-containing protein [Candidatus Bathyarchaeota archaeon]